MTDHAALAFDHWPDADQVAWLTAIQPEDFPDAGGPGAEWRAASRLAALGAYARLLGWLISTGVMLDAEAPADRITPERMKAYVAFLSKRRATVTRASYLGVLCMTVRAAIGGGYRAFSAVCAESLRHRGERSSASSRPTSFGSSAWI